jgi:hypothetical protein
LIIVAFVVVVLGIAYAQDSSKSSYSTVVITEKFQDIKKRMESAKPEVMKRQMELLSERYDLGNRPAAGLMMSGGKKPIQESVRAKLPEGMTWTALGNMPPDQIREKDLWPKGSFPLPHPTWTRSTA